MEILPRGLPVLLATKVRWFTSVGMVKLPVSSEVQGQSSEDGQELNNHATSM